MMANRSMKQPSVVYAARKIVNDCPDRNDECELEAIFQAIKHGNSAVKGLSRGVRYVSDPVNTDFFSAPHKILEHCAKGACGGDCDEHAALCASLAGAIGFEVGIRAWGPGREGGFEHVYAIVKTPKHSGKRDFEWLALDTTTRNLVGGPHDLGWEPPGGHYMDARLE